MSEMVAGADQPDGGAQEDADGWYGTTGPAWLDPEDPAVQPWIGPVPTTARWAKPRPPQVHVVLNERDLEVLRLLAGGESTADIAGALAYSESMIKHVIHGVVSRIGARNRAHAVAIAIRAGLI